MRYVDSERQLGIIVDLFLPLDSATRYDVYFTDVRIAIVYMGKAYRAGEALESHPLIFGVTPAAPVNRAEERKNRQILEEQINKLSLEEKLKLSKKSCFYTYDEVEEIKLISGKKHKFVILSKDCVSKFAPDDEQFRQLADLLPTIEMLKNKLSIFGNLKLTALQEQNRRPSAANIAVTKMTLTQFFARAAEIKFKQKYKTTQLSPRSLAMLVEQKIRCKHYSAKNAANRPLTTRRPCKAVLLER